MKKLKTQKWLEIYFKIIMNKYKYIIIKHFIQVSVNKFIILKLKFGNFRIAQHSLTMYICYTFAFTTVMQPEKSD